MNPLIRDRLDELGGLCAKHGVRRLELFGSAAGESFDPEASDLDFLVEFQDLTPGQYADAYFGLLEGLEGLFNKSVDLVESKAIRNPYFLQAIERTRVLLYAAA